MRRRSALVGAPAATTAAGLGNAFVGRKALTWFKSLDAPRWQLPMPGFVSVAAVYNVILGHVLAQGVDRRDASTVAWAVTVLACNEAWNVLLFGRRSTGAAFAGVLGFLVPLAGLQVSVWPDRRSRWSLLPSVGAWLSAAPQRSGHSIGRRRG